MTTAEILSILVTLLSEMPELIGVIQQDIADLKAGDVSADVLAARWSATTTAWGAAKARWVAAATPAAA